VPQSKKAPTPKKRVWLYLIGRNCTGGREYFKDSLA
jgi:hypothetical protein